MPFQHLKSIERLGSYFLAFLANLFERKMTFASIDGRPKFSLSDVHLDRNKIE